MNNIVQKTDAVVIGGGIIGCATAYYLAKHGVKVVLLEKGELGGEGTGMTFGLIRDIGRVPAEIPLAVDSLALWKELSSELNYDIGWIQGGGIEIAETEQKLEKFAKYSSVVRGRGIKCKVINADELRKLMPIEIEIAGGIYSENSGHAEPKSVIDGFANAARKLGALIYTQTPCWGVEVNQNKVSAIITTRGPIRTDTVINAAGAYASRIARMIGFHIPIKLVSCTVAETYPVEPLSKTWLLGPQSTMRQTIHKTLYLCRGLEVITEHCMDFYDFEDITVWLPRLYESRKLVHLRFDFDHIMRDIRRILGFSWKARRQAEFPIYEPKPNRKIAEAYLRSLKEMLPSLKKTELRRIWAGLLDLTPDMLPIIGELKNPKRFITAAGLSGHGFALGPRIGKLVAEQIVYGKCSLSLEDFWPYRFAEGKFTKPSEYYSI